MANINLVHATEIVPITLVNLQREVTQAYENACVTGDRIEADRILANVFKVERVTNSYGSPDVLRKNDMSISGLALIARNKSDIKISNDVNFVVLNENYWNIHKAESLIRQRQLAGTPGFVMWNDLNPDNFYHKDIPNPKDWHSPFLHEIVLMLCTMREGSYTHLDKKWVVLSSNNNYNLMKVARQMISDINISAVKHNSDMSWDDQSEFHSTFFLVYSDGKRSEALEEAIINTPARPPTRIDEDVEFSGTVALKTKSAYGKEIIVVLRDDETSVRCMSGYRTQSVCNVGERVSVIGHAVRITGEVRDATIVKNDFALNNIDLDNISAPLPR